MTRVPKALRPLAALARAQGWRITRTGPGHLRWLSPSGRPVITPSTPGGTRTVLNTRADLRRAGLDASP